MTATFNGFVLTNFGTIGSWSDGRVIQLVVGDDGALAQRHVLTLTRPAGEDAHRRATDFADALTIVPPRAD